MDLSSYLLLFFPVPCPMYATAAQVTKTEKLLFATGHRATMPTRPVSLALKASTPSAMVTLPLHYYTLHKLLLHYT